jgi:ribonucleoside-diphosphate reductase alpha chain
MLDMNQSSPFLETAAVDAWDAWFRWREHGELRDVSVDATWQRVANALAEAEADSQADWGLRYFDAQAQWRLLVDERILASAGTACAEWPANPVAVINAASFVVAPCTPQVRIDHRAMQCTAELAVRCLDNALQLCSRSDCGTPRVGLIGVADAIALLNHGYDSPAGRNEAGEIAKSLAAGCMRANVSLAAERGAKLTCSDEIRTAARARRMPQELIDDAIRLGLRHRELSAITSQRRLARFANNVSDALDPIGLPNGSTPRVAWSGGRPARSSGYAATVARMHAHDPTLTTSQLQPRCGASAMAQIELRGAVQPWIDAPIAYPLCVEQEPDADTQTLWRRRAADCRLGELCWHM